MTRTQLSVVLALAVLPLAGGAAKAQDVKWRNDYAAARKEAAETGRPLLLDFGTEACFWCKKLDATTFRDPKVVKLLNEQFVPVKIDAQKYQQLTNTLKIDGFPTLIVAAPDGKVVGRHPGYADAAQMVELLARAPAPAAPAAVKAPAVPNAPSKAEIDAGLAALFPEIAAALEK